MVVHEGIIWAPHSLLVLCLSHCSLALHKASEKPATDPGPQGEAWTPLPGARHSGMATSGDILLHTSPRNLNEITT